MCCAPLPEYSPKPQGRMLCYHTSPPKGPDGQSMVLPPPRAPPGGGGGWGCGGACVGMSVGMASLGLGVADLPCAWMRVCVRPLPFKVGSLHIVSIRCGSMSRSADGRILLRTSPAPCSATEAFRAVSLHVVCHGMQIQIHTQM